MLLNRYRVDWKHALGEIILIAIGVLIALAVDSLRDYQVERRLESEYINRIENDLQSALHTWDSHTERLEQAIDFLEHMRDGNLESLSQDNAANTWNAYMVSHWFAPPAFRSSAFEHLRSRSGFVELSNAQLTTHIGNIQFMGRYMDAATSLLEEIAEYESQGAPAVRDGNYVDGESRAGAQNAGAFC